MESEQVWSGAMSCQTFADLERMWGGQGLFLLLDSH